jgi:hypothetical protein
MDMLPAPTVIHPLTPPALLDLILATQSSTTSTILIVCSTRDAFLYDLLDSLKLQTEHDRPGLQRLITPTLHNLFTARHVRLVFCASVQTLLAYFTTYAGAETRPGSSKGGERERIVLVNPLRLHAPTPSFSAQGLSRTFAAAVEAASRADAALVVAECLAAQRSDDNEEADEEAGVENAEATVQDDAQEDPWEQQVSILNVSARRFGSGNADRAWAGRTVTAKRIAARWFRFHKIDDPSEPNGPD